eukprot:5484734-Amphidinium_carterae.1
MCHVLLQNKTHNRGAQGVQLNDRVATAEGQGATAQGQTEGRPVLPSLTRAELEYKGIKCFMLHILKPLLLF